MITRNNLIGIDPKLTAHQPDTCDASLATT